MFTNEADFKVFLNAVSIDYISEHGLNPGPDWDSTEEEPELAGFRARVILCYAPPKGESAKKALLNPAHKQLLLGVMRSRNSVIATLPASVKDHLARFTA